MKVAKLVAISLMTRVIVDENATEYDIIKQAKSQFMDNIQTDGISDNIEFIENDTDCPYAPETDK